ncbi:purine nucleosidase [Strigomonas culicis]|uniref:Purine nucleosidase n=1 Tax=Strigomonas culicis TaxID=28005 RepID=S9TPF1_9TRYP|nr:purine nucleosidase [Strigomonas culicis]|eukprot:EPY20147.1 purine nucleosidase [Strigomonas culicis]
MLKRKIIIDTDCGGDDAIAIMTALTDENTQVIAITAVWGNVDVDQGVQNLGKLLDLYGRDIPLLQGRRRAAGGHARDGAVGWLRQGRLWRRGLPTVRARGRAAPHTALAIIDLLRGAQPAEDEVYQLVCLGPLTNVALAMRIAPEVFSVLGSESEPAITIMGGASEAKGNSNLAAEFNIHCDPEAAHIVFHQREMKPIQLVTWEVTVDCCMTWHFYDTWVGRRSAQPQNATQAFVERMFQRLEAFTRPLEDGTKADTGDAEATQDATCVIPDAVAMVAALYPDSVLESLLTYSTVELYGRETRGETCIDWYGTDQSMAKRGRWRNCKLVSSIDNCKYLDVMEKIVNYTIEDI